MSVRGRFVAAGVALSLVGIFSPGVSGAGLLSQLSPAWRTLKAPAPAWYTPAIHEKVMAAGPRGIAIPAGVEIPASSLAFLGIRPGQLILVTNEQAGTTSLCTTNFVFNGGGGRAIGTAGHCGSVGDPVTMLFLPVGLVNIGRIVMSTGDAGVGHDFALISIDPALNQYVSPSMAHWGGPTGVYTGSGPAAIVHSGWGLVVGSGGTPRVGLGVTWTPDEWLSEAVIAPGDSGSGANVVGGLAAGNITHISVRGDTLTVAAGTSMTKILQLAGGYQLATCGLAIPWPLPGCPG